MRAKPKKDRIILVTDAMPTVGGPDSYSLYGQTIFLKDGRLVNAEGALAGAHVTMLQSIAFTVQQLEQTPEASLRMAITNPARLMGMERDVQIERTSPKDLILIGRGWDKLSFPFC
jgi:N-acetylglucosamine-6-phosphate deacetylase